MKPVPEVVGAPPGGPPPVSESPAAAAAAAALSLPDLNLILGKWRLQLVQNSTGVGGLRDPDLAECKTGTGSCYKFKIFHFQRTNGIDLKQKQN